MQHSAAAHDAKQQVLCAQLIALVNSEVATPTEQTLAASLIWQLQCLDLLRVQRAAHDTRIQQVERMMTRMEGALRAINAQLLQMAAHNQSLLCQLSGTVYSTTPNIPNIPTVATVAAHQRHPLNQTPSDGSRESVSPGGPSPYLHSPTAVAPMAPHIVSLSDPNSGYSSMAVMTPLTNIPGGPVPMHFTPYATSSSPTTTPFQPIQSPSVYTMHHTFGHSTPTFDPHSRRSRP